MEFFNLDERFFFTYVIFVVVRVGGGGKLNRGSDKFYTMTLKPME